MDRNRAKWTLLAAIASVGLLASCGGGSADEAGDNPEAVVRTRAGEEAGPSSYLCLACHSQSSVTVTGYWGVGRELQAVAPDAYYTSVHGDLSCVDCHEGQSALPHEKLTASGEPVARAVASEVCRSCHGGPAEHFLDSVHGTVIRLGDERAPACTDCHSAHSVQSIRTWAASEKAVACARCHDGADATFAGSLTHVEPSVDRLPMDYIATRFFGALVVAVVGIGILHVELDMLRWLRGKVTRKEGNDRKDRGR